MTIDPFLYVSLGAGFLAGRLVPYRGRWIGRATIAAIVVLVFLLGTTLGPAPLGPLIASIPLSVAFAILLLGIAVVVEQAIARGRSRLPVTDHPQEPGDLADHLLLPVTLVGALLGGFAFGRVSGVSGGSALSLALYALLALVGFDLRLSRASMRTVAIPVVAAVASALTAALAVSIFLDIPVRSALATSLAFGWYTLAGPLVTRSVGPSLGLVAFLTNFLRENLTMLSAPWAGRRLRAEGLAAMGGATTMDTTLYFVVRYGDRDAGALALSSGLILTVAASLLLPLVLGLPGP